MRRSFLNRALKYRRLRLFIISLTLFMPTLADANKKIPPRTSNGIGEIVTIEDRSIINALVNEVKMNEQGMALLKPEFYKKAHSTKLRCDGKRLFLLSDFDITVPDSVSKFDNVGFPNIGSGGHNLRIFLQDANGALSVAWNRVVIRSWKFQQHGNCPDLIVVLHGGEFGRVGYAYGVGRLRYRNGRYSILMKNGKTVEEK
jgi:hypothetical protein